MTDIVLVPGSHHGGWYYDPVLPALRAAGHRVIPVTLTGLGERRHLAGSGINLDTHVEDLVQVFDNQGVSDAVLVGHSYGGMVITAATDRLGERVQALTYLDAMVPTDGQSLWDLLTDGFRQAFTDHSKDGLTTDPLPGMDRRAAPHPLGTVFQPVRLKAGPDWIRRSFLLASGWEGTPFPSIYAALPSGWHLEQVNAGHDLVAEVPQVVADFILRSSAP